MNARYLKFVAKAGSNGFAAASEIQLMQAQHADRAELEKAIETAQGYQAEKYEEEGFLFLQEAVKYAQRILEQKDAPQSKVDGAVKRLQDAGADLKEIHIKQKVTARFTGAAGAAGSAPEAMTVGEGTSIVLPQNTFQRAGYSFTGWSDGKQVYQAGSSYVMADRDITFTAQWKQNDIPDNIPAPGQVQNLKASKITASKLTLSWKKADHATEYYIYRYEGKSKKPKITSTRTLKFTDKGLKAGTVYKYQVQAYNKADGQVKAGKISAVLTTAAAPKKPSVKAKVQGNTAKITWKKGMKADGFKVYIKAGSKKSYQPLKPVSPKKAAYMKKGLKKGKTYFFRVRGYKKAGKKVIWGAYSGVKRVTIK